MNLSIAVYIIKFFCKRMTDGEQFNTSRCDFVQIKIPKSLCLTLILEENVATDFKTKDFKISYRTKLYMYEVSNFKSQNSLENLTELFEFF